eukprot:714114_1
MRVFLALLFIVSNGILLSTAGCPSGHGFIHCASKDGICVVPSSSKEGYISYGSNTKWTLIPFTNTHTDGTVLKINCNDRLGVITAEQKSCCRMAAKTGFLDLSEATLPWRGTKMETETFSTPQGFPDNTYSVRYGTQDRFIIRPVVGLSVPCKSEYFGDPGQGIEKKCHWINDWEGASSPPPKSSQEWQECGPSGDYGNCISLRNDEPQWIRYGNSGKYVFRLILTTDGAIPCSDDFFGDPLPGESNRCWTSPSIHEFVPVLTDVLSYIPVSIAKSWYDASIYCMSQYGTQLADVSLSIHEAVGIQTERGATFDTIWTETSPNIGNLTGKCPTLHDALIGEEDCGATLPFLCESKYKWTPDACCSSFGTQLASIVTDTDYNQVKALMAEQTAQSWIGECSLVPQCSLDPNDCLQMSTDGTISNDCSVNDARLCNLKYSTRGVDGPVFGIQICADATLLDVTSQSTMTLQYYDDTLQSFRCIFHLAGAEPDQVYVCSHDGNAIQIGSYEVPHVVPRSITIDIAAFNTLSICGVSFIEAGYALHAPIAASLTSYDHYAVITVPPNGQCSGSETVTVSVHSFESCGVPPAGISGSDTGINTNDLSSISQVPDESASRRRLVNCNDHWYRPPMASEGAASKTQAAEAGFAVMKAQPNPLIAKAGRYGTAGAAVVGLFGGNGGNTQWITDGFEELHGIMNDMNACIMDYVETQITKILAQIAALQAEFAEDQYWQDLQSDVDLVDEKKAQVSNQFDNLEEEMNDVHTAGNDLYKESEYIDALKNSLDQFESLFVTQDTVWKVDQETQNNVYNRYYQIYSAQLLPILQEVMVVRFAVWMDWLEFNDFDLTDRILTDSSHYQLRSDFRGSNGILLVKYLDLLWASFGYLDDILSPIEAYINIESRYKPKLFCEWIQLTEQLTDLPMVNTRLQDFLDINTCPDQVFRYLKSKLLDTTNGYAEKYDDISIFTDEIDIHYRNYPQDQYELLWFPSYSDMTEQCRFLPGTKNENPSVWRTFSTTSLEQIELEIATHFEPGPIPSTWIYKVNGQVDPLLTPYFPSVAQSSGNTLCEGISTMHGYCYYAICPLDYAQEYGQTLTTHCLGCNEGRSLGGLKFAIAGGSIVGIKGLCRLQLDTYDALLDYEIQTVSWNIVATLSTTISWSEWNACPIGTYISKWTFYYRPMGTFPKDKSNLHFHSKVECSPYISESAAAHTPFQNEMNNQYDIPNQHMHNYKT